MMAITAEVKTLNSGMIFTVLRIPHNVLSKRPSQVQPAVPFERGRWQSPPNPVTSTVVLMSCSYDTGFVGRFGARLSLSLKLSHSPFRHRQKDTVFQRYFRPRMKCNLNHNAGMRKP
jgi:hypothetical protein